MTYDSLSSLCSASWLVLSLMRSRPHCPCCTSGSWRPLPGVCGRFLPRTVVALWGKSCIFGMHIGSQVLPVLQLAYVSVRFLVCIREKPSPCNLLAFFSRMVWAFVYVCRYVCMYGGCPSWRCSWDRTFQLGHRACGSNINTASLTLDHTYALVCVFC